MTPIPPERVEETEDEDDRGVATPLAITMLAAMFATILFGVQLGATVLTRHRAEGAADLAALAAAGHWAAGETAACARARRITDRMAVQLTQCRTTGVDAVIEVRCDVTGPLPYTGIVTASARAGWR
ncbi:Rv3654c family TadE-like protein [Actinoalloteichus hymeniacidonis]|uniref:Helicase/secretion neighborhood TadE-like protein n=1 Tax=Actinoalloteichus hymeniacidonis TaxID=340345 RepID=A0AAC9HL30_9PSEU|nr:Rv3654c family TadE-like protein [Actinoalloteichus hymeniacidonis]AOS61136.1 helicase/secretion neighborhood TadE-like protein [Actinoalloteichus hymeniacidonis]MBB5910863.1 secretion/DNA translocation related TadE-like protein [Actinoalloteichus hymeniacidonis]